MPDPLTDAGNDGVDAAALDAIVARGPSGAVAVAGVATLIVVALYFAFYFFVYLPRGAVH